jgi:hypothetical protein
MKIMINHWLYVKNVFVCATIIFQRADPLDALCSFFQATSKLKPLLLCLIMHFVKMPNQRKSTKKKWKSLNPVISSTLTPEKV